MTPITLALAIFAVMLVLMALRTPISIAMFVAGTVGYIAQAGWLPLANFLNTQAFARFASYDLSVIPLFLLMGNFATQGGISKALFEFAAVVMGRFRGGLAMARCWPAPPSAPSAARRWPPRRPSPPSPCPR
jgi:C4-dicarboxylate transporter, DctM subunit